jgi:hypothetical protein
MTRKEILDRASTALPTLARYYNVQGEYVEGKGDILAAYIAKVLIEDFNADPALGDGGQIAHLTAILQQAITDLSLVCEALETGEARAEETVIAQGGERPIVLSEPPIDVSPVRSKLNLVFFSPSQCVVAPWGHFLSFDKEEG